jgi:hypothetical protein
VTNPRVIDRYFDQSRSAFIAENFGFLSDVFHGMVARSCSDRTITLIEQASLDNPHYSKSPTAEYVTDERAILEELGKPAPIFSVSTVADLFAPYLVTDYSEWSGTVSLVVGDSVDDRLLFWNQHHRQNDAWIGSITGLRIPAARMADAEFLTLIKQIITQRGRLDSQSRVGGTAKLLQASLTNSVRTVSALIGCPISVSVAASFSMLFDTQIKGRMGSPSVAGSTRRLSAGMSPGSFSQSARRPPPARRTRPFGSGRPSRSVSPRLIAERASPVIFETIARPPRPALRTSAAANKRRPRSSSPEPIVSHRSRIAASSIM